MELKLLNERTKQCERESRDIDIDIDIVCQRVRTLAVSSNMLSFRIACKKKGERKNERKKKNI